MATTDFQFNDDRDRPNGIERKRNWWTTCLIGCLAMVVVAILLGTLAGVWIARNWQGWAATAASQAVKQNIDIADLPAEEKAQIMVEVERGATAFSEGRISQEQAAMLMEKLVNPALMTTLMASAAEKDHIERSGLSDDEKAQARMTLRRFLRGSIERKIDQPSIDAALTHVADRQPNGSWRLRNQVSDEQLQKFLAEAKKQADEAQVPEQPEEFDPSDEVKRIIDEAMDAPGASSFQKRGAE